MKIIIIGTAHPYRGGLASFNERMAKQLQDEGHEVIIYTFSVQYPSFLFPGKTQFSDEPAPKGLKIYRKVNSINPLNWCKVGREVRKLKPDLVLIKYWLPFMGACFGTILRRIKKENNTKVITVLDNIIPHESRIGDKQLTHYFVKPVDAFVSMSERVKNDLKQFDVTKPSAYNPHPIFDNFGAPVLRKVAADSLNLDENEKYILFFGIIRDYKGLDWLLKAFNLSKYRNKVKLIVAGEYYANLDAYNKLIADLNLEDRLIIHNEFIKNSEVKYWFSLANLLVQPYKNATQSGVTQIAYQFDLPMVVTNVGGLPEMIPDQKIGLVVEPRIEAIKNAIDHYFDKDLENDFRRNFEAEKQKYAWSKLNDTIFSLYKQIK